MIVEKNGVIARVQIKYAGFYTSKGRCQAALRVMGGNQSFYTAKKYAANAFEYLFVYSAKDESYLVPWNELQIRSLLSIEAPKYSMYRINVQG